MKKLFSIFFLAIFIFNSIGYYFLFLMLDSSNRSEIQASLFQSRYTETIRLHKSELKNIIFKEDGKEILYNGELYDVKDKFCAGDYFFFHCMNDKKETHLVAALDNQVKNNSYPCDNKKQNNFSKNPVKDLFFPEKNANLISSFKFEFPSLICPLPSFILQISSPPPEVSVS